MALAKLIWKSDTFAQDFLISWLKSEAFQNRLEGASRSAQAGFNKGDLATIQIQFPPLAEQHRIVAKVDELMTLCDQLEEEQENYLETHETLVSTLLNALTSASADASQFADAWQRIQDNFDILFKTESSVDQLKKCVLDLATNGLLTSSEMQWQASQFGNIFDIQGGNQPPKSQFISEPKEGYIRLLQIRDLGEKPVPTFIPKNLARTFCDENDILIGRYGASIGKIFKGQKGAYNVALVKLVWSPDTFSQDFLIFWLRSKAFQSHLESASRSAQAGFNKKDLSTIQISFPSLTEQHRIVEKINELMALCDQLKARLSSAQETQLNLANSIVEQAIHSPA